MNYSLAIYAGNMVLSIKRAVINHLVNCVSFVSIISAWIYVGSEFESKVGSPILDPWQTYGWVQTALLYFVRSLILLSLPLALFNSFGLVLFNAFPEKKLASVKVIPVSIFIFKADKLKLEIPFEETYVIDRHPVHLLPSGHERRLPAIGA